MFKVNDTTKRDETFTDWFLYNSRVFTKYILPLVYIPFNKNKYKVIITIIHIGIREKL